LLKITDYLANEQNVLFAVQINTGKVRYVLKEIWKNGNEGNINNFVLSYTFILLQLQFLI